MSTGNQRGERVPRREVSCANYEECKNVALKTPAEIKNKEKYGRRIYCQDCEVSGKSKSRKKPGGWKICTNPDCPLAGEPFYRRPSDKDSKTCSPRCGALMRTDNRRTLPDKICPVDDKLFRPSYKDQITCSPACRAEYRKTIDRTPYPCEGCEEDLVPKYPGQKYHGWDCRRVMEERICRICDKNYQIIPSDKSQTCERCRQFHKIKNIIPGEWHNGKPKRKTESRSKNGSRFYVQIWEPEHRNAYCTGWMAEHVYVLCQREGLDFIEDGFQVDHIDRNGLNNDPENLRLLTHAKHAAHTASETAKRAHYYDLLSKKFAEQGIDINDLLKEDNKC